MQLILFLFFFFWNQALANTESWLEVEIGIIGTASEDILHSAIQRAEKQKFQGLIIRLDTAGGSLDATRKMVKGILNASVPIVVWVGPSGSRAASAGSFITIAGHVAAMSPGTNIGAAHPISVGGGEIKDNAAGQKVVNDTVAFMDSIALARGRNQEMARSFVSHSVSITAQEALDHHIIDMIAENKSSLLSKLNGRKVTLGSGQEITLKTEQLGLVSYKKSFRQSVLEILSNPNLFYLLFMAGLIGLGFELTHPGSIFPGVAGGICMILALIATSVLPVSFGAVALILVGIALLVAEAFVPSFGILGLGGFTAFFLGSIFLVDPDNEQGLRISISTIAPTAIFVGLCALGIGYLVMKTSFTKHLDQSEALVEQAKVIKAFKNGQGQVRLAGEIWSASTADNQVDLQPGSTVRVVAKKGLSLEVEPVEKTI